MREGCILGIDTSNYKTSVALVAEDGSVIRDMRTPLRVKQGERGLRQSDALFQHIENLPVLIDEAFKDGIAIKAVACSIRPRPVRGSYMPVFRAGEAIALSVSAAAGVPCLCFSHQEGHIEAVKRFSAMKDSRLFLACHFSGGTCEILKVKDISEDMKKDASAGKAETRIYSIDIIGGSKDISFGQVIDRAGVASGLSFPSGEEADRLALSADDPTRFLSPIKAENGWINLSGIDTQARRIIEGGMREDMKGPFFREIFDRIVSATVKMVSQASEKSGIRDIIMAGGVSSSVYMRERIRKALKENGINTCFGSSGLSQDNAVGIALLGGRMIWR